MARTRNEAAFAAKKTLILRAAEALFVEKGFHQTGIAALCKAIEMSPGALYRYFPSKTAIIRALVTEDLEQQRARFTTLGDAPDFLGALTDVMVITTLTMREPAYKKLAMEIAAEAERDEEIGEMLASANRESHQHLKEALEGARERGAVRADLDAEDVAHLLIGMIDGAMANALPVTRLRRATSDMLTRWLA